MAANNNPFLEMDITKMMADFKMPGLDMEALVSAQRRNVEALTQANQLAVECMQAVARRQSEILRQTMEEASKSMRDLFEQGPPEDKLAKQTELAKVAMEKALANMRELAEMVTKSNREAFDVINRRVTESMDEMKGLMSKRAGAPGRK